MSLLSKSIVAALSALVLATPALAQPFPEVIPLPTGFQPEGIAAGRGSTFFVGSIPTGAVFRGDLRTGDGDLIVPGREGRSSIGIKVDGKDRIFVAGGDTGRAFVYDATTGAPLADYLLAPSQPTFVNDVVLTRDAAWFTDSFRAVLYRVPFGPGGSLPGASDVAELPLTGDFELQEGFNLNGIEATSDGGTLLVIQSNTGLLFSVDPGSGVTVRLELVGGDVSFGDGILLQGTTLYVVQNQLNRIAVIDLEPSLSGGTVVDSLTDPDLDVPTTIARWANFLWAVNARFGIEDPEAAAYSVARVAA